MNSLYIKTYPIINGFMLVWDKVEEALRYNVHLYIATYSERDEHHKPKNTISKFQEIDCIEVARNKNYYTFKDLAILTKTHLETHGHGTSSHQEIVYDLCQRYLVKVEAEDKFGNIISETENIACLVENDIVWR